MATGHISRPRNYPNKNDPDTTLSKASGRFSDRHAGTNVLMLNGSVLMFETRKLDDMLPGAPDCVWSTE